MLRRFNTAGPCRPDLHYMIPAERRLPEAPGLVEQGGYFVVHAPRQTGKTTALRALARRLTDSGSYAALHFSCESGEAAGDDFGEAQRALLAQMRRGAELYLPAELQPPPFPKASDSALLSTALTAWARSCPRPLVLFFDEIDALRGQSLLSVLRQLRSGFSDRPWPYTEAGQRRWQRHALELKVWREGEKDPLSKGLTQLDACLERLGLDGGVLVIFDRRPEAHSAESRTRFEQARTPSGREVTVLRA
jgi:hypothetical protein